MSGTARGALSRGRAAAVSLLLSLAGCGVSRNSLHAPPGAPSFEVIVAASEVTLINGTNAADVRELGAEAIDAMMGGTGNTHPARFRATVTTVAAANSAAAFYCYLPLVVPTVGFAAFFCPDGRIDVSVDLVVETEAQVFKGAAEVSSLMPSGSNTDDWRALVYNAFQEAMLDALWKSTPPAAAKTAKR